MVRQEIGIRKKRDKKTEDADMGFGDWGSYMAAKRAKLIDQFHDAKNEVISNIFEGVAIHVNGLTKPPIDVLKNLMGAHGGLFHAYQTSSTTHIIASNLANVKIKKLGSVPIVKPSWISDSIDMGKLLDYRRYLLYTYQSLSQPGLQFPVINSSKTVKVVEDSKDQIDSINVIDKHDSEAEVPFKISPKTLINDFDMTEDDKSNNGNDDPSHASHDFDSISYEEPADAVNHENLCEDIQQISVASNSNEVSDEICVNKTTAIPQTTTGDEVIDGKATDKQMSNKTRASTKTASDPTFLEEFYNNSRLHLISTLGAEYKQLVNQLREKSVGKFPGLEKLKAKGKQTNQISSDSVIMHIDMDCFFVSVGLRNHPELRGKPVAIAHARSGEIKTITSEQKMNREQEYALYSKRLPIGVTSRVDKIDTLSSMSEIASCSYEARKFGIRNGMFLGQAVKMCPDLKMLPYDFEGYKEVSRTLYNIIASYTLDIEAVSCDEMYVDLTKLLNETGFSVEEWADHIRHEITTTTGCPCSTGFGSNRLQARLATRKAKPAGKFYLERQDVESYMAEIPLSDLPGVGRATLTKLKNLGLNTCGDIQTISLRALQNEIGQKFGETLKEQAMGIDKKPLNFSHERKSVSAEVNYGIRFKTLEECHSFLQNLSTEVYKRLRSINMKARCVTLKLLVRSEDAPLETAKFLGHGICDSLSKSTMNVVINDSQAIYKEVLSLYNKLNPCFTDLRGIGIQLSKLEKIAPMNSAISNFLKQPSTSKHFKENEKTENKSQTTQIVTSKSNPRLLDPGEGTSTGTVKVKPAAFSNNKNCDGISNSGQIDIPLTQIDYNVLKELPEELRREIIPNQQLKLLKQARKPNTIPTISKKQNDMQDYENSPFYNLNWEEMKPLIKRWATSSEKPEELDVVMMGKHFKAYAIDRKIEFLFTILNSLHRMFSNLSCEWHKAYFTIINITQEGMIARYGNTLMVKRSFACCHI